MAYADRFPRLRLSLTGGLENDELKGFFRSPFSYIIGSITGTIFDFGRNKRRHRAAHSGLRSRPDSAMNRQYSRPSTR